MYTMYSHVNLHVHVHVHAIVLYYNFIFLPLFSHFFLLLLLLSQELEENVNLSSSKRKQLYDSRKGELHSEQKKIEDEHLQILKTQAEHDMVDFRQKLLHEKQNIEKQLLQEVRN